jgi:ABC-2 type transport system ATP-binding protein
MPQTVIEARNLKKVFKDTVAVDGISFSVKKGEFLGLLGPNGAGKTTTIAMLLGLLKYTSGTISVLGMKMPEERQKILSRVNFSSAYVQLPYGLSVTANLKVHARLYQIPNGDKKFVELAEYFGIADLLKRRMMTLSSGQATRVNLVKAFLNDPEILFLDEPTSSLDPEAADTFRQLIQAEQKRRKLTILYTSHNMQEVEKIADRIIFLHQGKIVAQGTTKEVLAKHKKKNLEDFFIALARTQNKKGAK